MNQGADGRFLPGNKAATGRTKKTLTALLDLAGSKTIDYQDRHIARRRVVADMVWQAITEGKIEFTEAHVVSLNYNNWLDLLRWLYDRMDGKVMENVTLDMPTGAIQPVFMVRPPGGQDEPGPEQ